MSGSDFADMVFEDGKKGVGKLDNLFTNTFPRHLKQLLYYQLRFFSFAFFPKNGGKTNLKKIKNHVLNVVIKTHHECVIIEHSAFRSTTNKTPLF